MAGGILAPSNLNLIVGKCFAQFQRQAPVVDAAAVHLGMVTDIEYTPDVPIAKFIAENQGIAIVADAIPVQYGGRGKITIGELTLYNYGLLMQGNPNYSNINSPSLAHYGYQAALTGILTLTMTNGKGPRLQSTYTNVLMTPASAFRQISKEYGTFDINFEHLADANLLFGTSTLLADVNTIAPTNWQAPFVVSPVAGGTAPAGGTPAYANHTTPTVLTCNIGQWTGGVGFSVVFQWYRNATNSNTGGTAISGATNQNYTPVAADVGDYLYCTVTGTNSIGSTATPSGTTQAVV